MGRRGDRRPKEVMDPGCPSDKRNLRNRLWQAGRDNDADHNGTSSQLPKDLGRVPAAFACSGKAAATGVAAKEAVLAHFQYTSDFPVASDRSVMGNEPKPPNRPMSMSNVSVTVTSSLS